MTEGYVKLYRQILNSDVFASQKMLKIWVWCLCRANYKARSVPCKTGRGETIVKLNSGEFIFGRFKAEEELNIDGSTIYKIIKQLESFGNISIKSSTHYSVITICNWDRYQQEIDNEVTTNEQPSNNQVTTNEQPSNTDKKDKKDKNDKNNIPPLLENVIQYCIERDKNIDANKWYNFYQSKGWMIGKNKMKDWKAAVRTWEKEPEERKMVL